MMKRSLSNVDFNFKLRRYSWVPKLRITRENFDTMCPRGQKITKFAKCTHEIFAVFGECARWDGMTVGRWRLNPCKPCWKGLEVSA
jgi:hypothetical protein